MAASLETRRGDWISTFTGRVFWPLDPRPEDVDIVDIAHALSHLCRWGGHTTAHWSVAQHSIMVSEIAPQELALAALLHDAAEAYIGDLMRPVKRNLRFESETMQEVEDRILWAIGQALDVPDLVTSVNSEEIETLDLVVMMTECRDLRPGSDANPVCWDPKLEIAPLPTRIVVADRRQQVMDFVMKNRHQHPDWLAAGLARLEVLDDEVELTKSRFLKRYESLKAPISSG